MEASFKQILGPDEQEIVDETHKLVFLQHKRLVDLKQREFFG